MFSFILAANDFPSPLIIGAAVLAFFVAIAFLTLLIVL